MTTAGHHDRARLPRRGRPGYLRQILGDLSREWMNHAACADLPLDQIDDLFFPDNAAPGTTIRATYQANVTRAKHICRTCPVQIECEQYRVAIQDPNGVWGGRDEIDRSTRRKRTEP